MKPAPHVVKAACILAVFLVASCAKEPPPPLPVAVVPPAAPPPPPVGLPSSVIEAASAYRTYMQQASGITAAFADGEAVHQSIATGAAYEPNQLLRGAIAYAAVVALQSPQFVAGVRTHAVNPTARRELAVKLVQDPNYASALPSVANAAGLVAVTLHADAAKVRRAGELVKQAAYDVQRQSWARTDITGGPERLDRAKTLSAQAITPSQADVALLTSAINGRDEAGVSLLEVGGDALGPPYTNVVSRGLALAGLAALGEAATPAFAPGIESLLDDSSSAFCLNMSKLNLYQCLSVAKPYYEDVFCLGQHILLDTAQCVAKAAGDMPVPTLAATTPPPGAAAVVSTSVQ